MTIGFRILNTFSIVEKIVLVSYTVLKVKVCSLANTCNIVSDLQTN